ncbi:MAG: glycosyltransferase family 4 protein [Candidatus Lindowbacteria bacterium]|nr:glycosyltransferase family 4 protein [Candidatus Lindowbacteria bacterium]
MKLACIGPLGPLKTGVADFSESLLPYLAEWCDIKLFTDAYTPTTTAILSRYTTADISAFVCDPSAFDVAIYHMGNHYRFHKGVFEAIRRVPSIVLLHDCVLNQFFAKLALERGNFAIFRRLLEYCHPDISPKEAALFFEVKGDPYRYPMAGIVDACSRGTIVMNEYGRSIVLREAPRANILRINFPHFATPVLPESATAFRAKHGIPGDWFVVTSIGHMTPAKRIDVALEAFRKFNEKFPESVFLLAGEASPRFPLAAVTGGKWAKNVRFLGYLSRAELEGLREASDVCINLRYPSNGEMSSTLIEMIGRGKVVVVSNYAQFAEFPDSTCVKINVGPGESDDLAGSLLELARNPDQKKTRSQNRSLRRTKFVAFSRRTTGPRGHDICSYTMRGGFLRTRASRGWRKQFATPCAERSQERRKRA